MDVTSIGKWIVLSGLALTAVGALVWVGAKFGLPVGRLPGDITVKGDNSVFYFPLATGLAISVILTVILNVLLWVFKK